jgi:hypothetical protein
VAYRAARIGGLSSAGAFAEIDRFANSPCPLPEREQRIAALEQEIEQLQRTEETIVATGAPRERGCPAWVVLGVRAVESRADAAERPIETCPV